MGFKKSRKRQGIDRIRSNPDLDEYIYKDKNGDEMIYKYKSSMPKGINDIIPNKNEVTIKGTHLVFVAKPNPWSMCPRNKYSSKLVCNGIRSNANTTKTANFSGLNWITKSSGAV